MCPFIKFMATLISLLIVSRKSEDLVVSYQRLKKICTYTKVIIQNSRSLIDSSFSFWVSVAKMNWGAEEIPRLRHEELAHVIMKVGKSQDLQND